jgi:hypothetical protein
MISSEVMELTAGEVFVITILLKTRKENLVSMVVAEQFK